MLRKLRIFTLIARVWSAAAFIRACRVLLHRDEIIIEFWFSSDLARKQLANSSREVSLSLKLVSYTGPGL